MSLCYGEDNDCRAPHCLIEAKELNATLPRRKQKKDPLIHQARSDNFIGKNEECCEEQFTEDLVV